MRAIVFDLDGTLLCFTREYRDIVAEAFRAVVGEVREEWLDAYERAFFARFDAFDPEVYRRSFAAATDRGDPAAFVRALREAELAACRPPPGTADALERLGERFALGVLTNGVTEWQERKLEAHGLAPLVDAVVVSYDVGAHKPDPAIFRAAEARLPAAAYAMVGDADADVDGARRAGWTAYRYRGGGFEDLPGALEWE